MGEKKLTGLDMINGKEMATFPRDGGEEENIKTLIRTQLVGEEKLTGLPEVWEIPKKGNKVPDPDKWKWTTYSTLSRITDLL